MLQRRSGFVENPSNLYSTLILGKDKSLKAPFLKLVSQFLLLIGDSSFPRAQFHILGYCSSYRLDRNSHEGEILLYIREDIHSKFLVTGFRKRECL